MSSRRSKTKRQRKKLIGCIVEHFDAEALRRLVEKRRQRNGVSILHPIDKQARSVIELLVEEGHSNVAEQLICAEIASDDVSREEKRKLVMVAGARGYLNVLHTLAVEDRIASRSALCRGVVQIAHHVDCVVRSLLIAFRGVDASPFVTRVLDYLYEFPEMPTRANRCACPGKRSRSTYALSCADVHLFCPFGLFRQAANNRDIMLQILHAAAEHVPPNVLPAGLQASLISVLQRGNDMQITRQRHVGDSDSAAQSFLPLKVLCRLVARGFNTLMVYQLLRCQDELMHAEWMRLRKWKSLDGLTAWHLAAICGDEQWGARLGNMVTSQECGGVVPFDALVAACRPMVNGPSAHGDTAFLLACAAGNSRFVRFCLEARLADVRIRTARNETALILAAKKGHMEVVSLIVHYMVCDLSDRVKRHQKLAAKTQPAIAPARRSEDHWLSWTVGNGNGEDVTDGEEMSESDVLEFIRHRDVDGYSALSYAKQLQDTSIAQHLWQACSQLV